MTTSDLRIDFAPNGNGLRLTVQGGNLPAPDVVDRQMPMLEPSDVERLRQADGEQALCDRVALAVSNWLLGQDLRVHVQAALNSAEDFRLVVAADRTLYLDDIPLELCELGGTPLALKPKLRAIVHLLPFARNASQTARTLPFDVLIVRCNPDDHGGDVPEGEPIRAAIYSAAAGLPKDMVRVRLLSREPGADGPPTWAGLRDEVRRSGQDVLVYLGHGDLLGGDDGTAAVGALKFETDDGQHAQTIASKQLAVQLQNNYLPLVLLAGCFTAAQGKPPPAVPIDVPRWLRGSQGVAQALVDSESGVQCAIGMRYSVDGADATRFLTSFFRSLLSGAAPGDVEAALRAARLDLHAANVYPPSWSAPVLYKAPGAEPMFGFLANPVVVRPEDQRDQEVRRLAWDGLSKTPLSARAPESFEYKLLDMTENGFRARAEANHVPVLMPSLVETDSDQPFTTVLKLSTQLTAERLAGRLSLPDGVAATSVRLPDALAAEFKVQADQPFVPGEVQFTILSRNNQAASLSPGDILQVSAVATLRSPMFFEMQLQDVVCSPATPLAIWTNAIVVSPP